MQAVAKFIEVSDCLNMNADNPVIGEIRTPLEQVYMILKRLHGKLGPDFT